MKEKSKDQSHTGTQVRNVFSFSKFHLNEAEIGVLSKGLNVVLYYKETPNLYIISNNLIFKIYVRKNVMNFTTESTPC